MFKVKAITAVVVAGIIGLAACGGESSDKDDSTVTTVRQRNGSTIFFATSEAACTKAGKKARKTFSGYYCY